MYLYLYFYLAEVDKRVSLFLLIFGWSFEPRSDIYITLSPVTPFTLLDGIQMLQGLSQGSYPSTMEWLPYSPFIHWNSGWRRVSRVLFQAGACALLTGFFEWLGAIWRQSISAEGSSNDSYDWLIGLWWNATILALVILIDKIGARGSSANISETYVLNIPEAAYFSHQSKYYSMHSPNSQHRLGPILQWIWQHTLSS